FFQAEDGIRGYKVTGVQTCAIPISLQDVGRAPSALGIQQTSTYDPGSSARVAQAVSPTVTALGPPAKAIHGGGGVWFFIAASSPAWKSAMVLPSPSRTSEAWWSSLP